MENPPIKYPVVAGSVLLRGKRAIALLARSVVEIECPGQLAYDLLRRCDGRTTLAQIREALSYRWNARDLDRLIAALGKQGVLVDANAFGISAWEYAKNPRWFGPEPTESELAKLLKNACDVVAKVAGVPYRAAPNFPIRKLLERRRSTRTFSDAAVPYRKILALLWAAYGTQALLPGEKDGIAHRTVPSAGGLFPLQVHLVNLRAGPGLDRGVYHVRYARRGAVALQPLTTEIRQIYRAFEAPDQLKHAQGIVTISGTFGQTAGKYGNRAILYVPIEAGHAAQNLMLAATDCGIASIEIGGFREEKLRECLGMNSDAVPLTTVVFGSPAHERPQPSADADFTFRWYDLDQLGVTPTFSLGMVQSTAATGEADFCWGRDADPLQAFDKAMAEAYERRGCETPKGVYRCSMRAVRRALDPRDIVAYDLSQYRTASFPFRRFSETRVCAWKDGTDYYTGAKVPVLVDLAYLQNALPAGARKGAYTWGTTSGVAAHTSRERALENAVLELIERDAFMTVWLGRLASPEITFQSLPRAIQSRIRSINGLGARVVVKDITQGFLPTVLVFAQHRGRSMTVVSAAAAYEPEDALEHALSELEATLFVRLLSGKPAKLLPQEVMRPGQHGDLYAQPRYFRRADFLGIPAGGRKLSGIDAGTVKNWSRLSSALRKFHKQLVGVDLTPPGASLDQGRIPLHVVRALIPGLIPINFGYGTEPLGLPKVRQLLHQRGKYRLTQAGSFPHPFS